MSKAPMWLNRLLVGGVSALTVGGVGFGVLLGNAGTARHPTVVTVKFSVEILWRLARLATGL